MTVSEKHMQAAREIARNYDTFPPSDRIVLSRQISAALAAAEREGREDERKRCAEKIARIEPDEDAAGGAASWGDFVQIAQSAILSQANTHSEALPPGATEQAGTVSSSSVSAPNHASRNGEG